MGAGTACFFITKSYHKICLISRVDLCNKFTKIYVLY